MENGEVGMGVLLPGAINKSLQNLRRDTEKNGIIRKKEKNEKIVIKKENTTNPNVK